MAENYEADAEAPVYVIPNPEARDFAAPTPAPSPAPSVPAPPPAALLTAQRKTNQKLWDTVRSEWLPGDPTDMIEYHARVDLALKNQLAQLADGPGDAPRLSHNPAEAKLGLEEPVAPDPDGFLGRLELGRGEAFAPEDRIVVRGVGSMMPPSMTMATERLMRQLDAHRADPTRQAVNEEDALLAVTDEEAGLFRVMRDRAPAAVRQWFDAGGFDPSEIKLIAAWGAAWLETPAGHRWQIRGGWKVRQQIDAQARADRMRIQDERAEAAAAARTAAREARR